MSASSQCTRPEHGDRLAAYELGALSPADRAAFEAHLGECAFCLDELFEAAPAIVALLEEPGRIAALLETPPAAGGERAARRVDWRARLAELRARALSPAGLGHAWAPVAVLAMLLLLVFVPDHPRRLAPGFGSLARLEPAPYAQIETRDAAGTEAERLFRRGMERYVDGRYAQAARLLREAIDAAAAAESRPRVLDQARLYLGISLVLSGQAAAAVPALERAAASPLPPLAERARWYLGQALLLEDAPREAVALLRDLAERSPVYGPAATEQLNAVWRLMIERGIELPDHDD